MSQCIAAIKRAFLLAAIVGASAATVACGGGSGEPRIPNSDELLNNVDDGNDVPSNIGEPVPFLETDVPVNQRSPIFIDEAKLAVANGPYKSSLLRCAQVSAQSPCTLGELPMIGQATTDPTVQDIMNRVVITHDWAGVRFEQILQRLPSQTLRLFKPVTLVYIGSENEYTQYSYDLGSLRIKIDDLWINETERKAVYSSSNAPATNAPASASADNGLQFEPRIRWMLGAENVYDGFATVDRQYQQITIAVGMAIYEFLAYPNNFARADSYGLMVASQYPNDIFNLDNSVPVSQELYLDQNLTFDSSYLYSLANVHFNGEELGPGQDSFTAQGAGAEIGAQGKPSFYSFQSQLFDTVTLFILAMAKMNHNVYLDVAMVEKPLGPRVLGCDDYKIGWGVRNRIAAPKVSARARFVVEQFIGQSADTDNFFSNKLGQEVSLPVGFGWCDSQSRVLPAN